MSGYLSGSLSAYPNRPTAEKGPTCWADHRKVTQIAFKPDWTNDGKAAPFKRNACMLDIVPAGVIVFPGSSITGNLANKAKKLGVPVLDHREGGVRGRSSVQTLTVMRHKRRSSRCS